MNINFKNMSFLALILAAPMMVSAQSVKDLCEKNVEGLGGKSAVEAVKLLKITQVGTSQGNNMPMTTVLIPGKAYYQKVRTGTGSFTTCVNGDEGWTYTTSPAPKSNTIPVNMMKSLLVDSKFYGPLYDYYVNGAKADVSTITSEGCTTIDRENCYKLVVTYKSGYKATVYLSSQSYMIKKVESATGIIKYNNYKKTCGVMIPRYVEMSNGNGTVTAVVSEVNVNCKVTNDLFSHP